MRIWGRIIQNNHLLRDTVIEDTGSRSRTEKVFHSLDEMIMELDLAKPVWLDKNIREFQRHARTRFTSDNFMEPIDFDYLDFYVIEED